MPIKIPGDLPAFQILENENIFVMDQDRATTQDIRPLKIAIMNLMPTKIVTETQLLRLVGNTPIQVDVTLLQSDTHDCKNTDQAHLDTFYKTFSDVRYEYFDGLIITGAPIETLPFEEVDYWDELVDIMDWSLTHVYSTLHICWGAQAALYHHYGVPKHNLDHKLFGVFEHHLEEKYIPLFIPGQTPGNPNQAMLLRELCDSHSASVRYNMFGYNTVPAEVRNADDRVFVIADGPLRKGDEILSIDGRGWKSTHDGLARFEAASNAENRNYMTAMCMVCSHRDTAAVELVRDGRRMTERIATRSVMNWSPYITERMLDTANIRLLADGIGYMTGVNYTKADGARIMEKFRDTKALIVDLRCYPREFMIFDFIGRYFMPRTSPHVIWLAPTGALPGVFHELQDSLFVNPDNPAVAENPDYYKGRVIVLVDSSTQSQAEYTAMAFQATPRCTVVGTQTAGADGNISALVMPGGDFGYFSGLGVLYPDGTNTQRAGVRIDVPVYATVPGLQAGRDEILEKALEIIATGAYDPAAKI